MAAFRATRSTQTMNGGLAGPIAVQTGQELGEDLLGDVVGVVDVVHDPQHVGMDGRRVQNVQLAHRLPVASARGAHHTPCAAFLGVAGKSSRIPAAVNDGARRSRAAIRQHQGIP